MEDGWRYIAQRFDGTNGGLGQFLDMNVPLQGVQISDVLSGHNSLSGTITPEYPRLKAADGQPLFVEGGTAIWAESPDGEIRGGGLLIHSGFGDDGSWDVECEGLTGATIGLPYDGADFFVNVDPMDVFRFIWARVQNQRNLNLGISIDPTKSPVLLGSDLVQGEEFDTEPDPSEDLEPAPAQTSPPRYPTNTLWREAAVKALKAKAWKEADVDAALRKWLNKDNLVESGDWKPLTEKERKIRDRAIETIGWPPNPPNPGRLNTIVWKVAAGLTPPDNGGSIVDETAGDGGGSGGGDGDSPGPTYQYEAYKLNWYSNMDLSTDIDDLAANTPFDWHLVDRWDGDEITHHIRLGYPRLGRRREELRFVVGENIHTLPSVERDGTEYANEVWVYGAGEGSQIIVGRAERRDDGRVRKIVTISDPTITTVEAANRRAEQELAKRYNIDNITDLVVVDHPHAPMGSVDLGDEIFVEGDLGWIDLEVWCRVIGRTMSPDDSNSQTLTLMRSDRIA